MATKDSPETERFINLAKKIVQVPKREVDKQIEKERKARQRTKITKKKI